MPLIVIIPVLLETDDFGDSDAIAVECPECFSIIRKSRLDDHKAVRHA
jgi:hypothetical protein